MVIWYYIISYIYIYIHIYIHIYIYIYYYIDMIWHFIIYIYILLYWYDMTFYHIYIYTCVYIYMYIMWKWYIKISWWKQFHPPGMTLNLPRQNEAQMAIPWYHRTFSLEERLFRVVSTRVRLRWVCEVASQYVPILVEWCCYFWYHYNLVGGLEHFLFFHILRRIIPTG